jgi:4-carboxymuconolactone decarboxylase
MTEDEALFQKGMPIRREVLGPEYVDASMARADDFMMSFQRATTAWAWGWAWGEGTLDRKTRSLMNLVMLTALNRAPEIKLHVKGALNNGVTVEEIKAALLHATAYCGIPAGLDAFRAAHEVLVSEGASARNADRAAVAVANRGAVTRRRAERRGPVAVFLQPERGDRTWPSSRRAANPQPANPRRVRAASGRPR